MKKIVHFVAFFLLSLLVLNLGISFFYLGEISEAIISDNFYANFINILQKIWANNSISLFVFFILVILLYPGDDVMERFLLRCYLPFLISSSIVLSLLMYMINSKSGFWNQLTEASWEYFSLNFIFFILAILGVFPIRCLLAKLAFCLRQILQN